MTTDTPAMPAPTVAAQVEQQPPPRGKRPPRNSSLQKYKRVEKQRDETPDDEIRVMGSGRVPRYVAYASKLFTEQDRMSITIRATGKAVAIAVSVCEVIKRRFKGLYQETSIGWTEVIDEYEPLEEGLERREEKRSVPSISVLLTKDETKVDKNSAGYQEPLDESLVQDDPEAFANVGQRAGRRPVYRQRRNKAVSREEGPDPAPFEENQTDGPVRKNYRRRRGTKRLPKKASEAAEVVPATTNA